MSALVTGATDGLGRALAERIAGTGRAVIVHGRDAGRVERAVSEIRAATGNEQVRPARADLSELAQVRALAGSVGPLDVLVNNAGIGADVPGGGRRQVSADGYELRFAVNYLAGYLLTRLLLPSLSGRIVNVSSAGQAPIDFADVMLERDYDGWRAYRQSKLAQIMFTFDLAEELAGELAGTGVTATALHPATFMPTKIVPSPISSLEEGVEATYRLVAAPELAGVSGRYYDGLREARAHPQAYDLDARARLRELSERLTSAPSA